MLSKTAALPNGWPAETCIMATIATKVNMPDLTNKGARVSLGCVYWIATITVSCPGGTAYDASMEYDGNISAADIVQGIDKATNGCCQNMEVLRLAASSMQQHHDMQRDVLIGAGAEAMMNQLNGKVGDFVARQRH